MPLVNTNWTTIAFASVGATVTGYAIYKLISNYSTENVTNALPVRVCNHLSDWVTSEGKFLKVFSDAKVIGLDCEWVTVKDHRNPVSLLQLATADGFCVLVRLCNIPPWLMPSGLIDLLRDTNILKVGVGIYEDSKKLLLDYGLCVKGCLDLRQLVKGDRELEGRGLQFLAHHFLNVKLKKSASLTCSDWEEEYLTPKQIAYAANDSIAAVQIYKKIKDTTKAPRSTLLVIDKATKKLIDIPYKNSNKTIHDGPKLHQHASLSKDVRFKKILTRSKPMYENCQLQAPDGEPLCSCDKKKAQWYVEKGRAVVVNEKPFTVRLNFEPSGRPILDNKYYIQEKRNCCVVCGETKFFFRKSVVPSEYRRYFPNLMKRNLSHDVVLLCVACHRKSNVLDQTLRQKLEKECDAPIKSEKSIKIKINQDLVTVKSAAKALLRSVNRIPDDRKEELNKIVCNYYKTENVTEEQLKEASQIVTYSTNEKYVPHGLKVYQHMCKNGGLIMFESMWRQHFLDSMQPKYMPKMWSIDHNHERLALQVTRNKVDFDISILGLSPELITKAKNLQV